MKRTFIYTLAIALAAVSCNKEVAENTDTTPSQREHPQLFASIDGSAQADTQTKVYADSDLDLHWNAGDQISVFYNDDQNAKYSFNGKEGDSWGTFSYVSGAEEEGLSQDKVIAVYPFGEEVKLSAEGTLSLRLPAVQTYAAGGIGQGANTMLAISDDNKLNFKNLCAYISIKLQGVCAVSEISLSGNNLEQLAGLHSLDINDDQYTLSNIDEDYWTKVTIRCESPLSLSDNSSEAKEFIFVLPPVTFTKGFTLTITDSEGKRMQKRLKSELKLSRNEIRRMATLNVETSDEPLVPDMVDMGLSYKWASFNVGASSPEESGNYYAWADTEARTSFTYAEYKYWDNDVHKFTKYCDRESDGTVDNLSVIQAEDDVARVSFGGTWHILTRDEANEMSRAVNNTKESEKFTEGWVNLNGVKCFKITNPKTGASIFFPAAGYYDRGDLKDYGEDFLIWCSRRVGSEVKQGSHTSSYYYHSFWTHFNGGYRSRTDGMSVRATCR